MDRVAMLPLVLVALGLPAGAQQTTSHTGSATGSIAPMHSGAYHSNAGHFNTGQFNPFRPNAYGANSGAAAPPPSWELPRVTTPHWEIPSYIPVQPNPVRGNPASHGHGARGVGYVGLPYYADPFAFVDADTGDDIMQQPQAVQQARPEYAPQQGYTPQDYAPQGYAPEESPAARRPYNPGAYAAPATPTAAEQNAAADDGLDHPEVTLVFKDGREPLKVRSYVLTGSSVFVAEHGHERKIPLSELDLPATFEQNREAGVDFVLPGSGR